VCDRALCQKRHVYAIRNGRVEPRWPSVERRTTKVARRALETLIYAQGTNDLYRKWRRRVKAMSFNVAYIDAQFNYPNPTAFAPDFEGKRSSRELLNRACTHTPGLSIRRMTDDFAGRAIRKSDRRSGKIHLRPWIKVGLARRIDGP